MTPAFRLVAALAAVYVVWGSTYLAIAVAVEGLPPLLAAALRFIPAGIILVAGCRLLGRPPPTLRQWLHALPVGGLMLTLGNGLVCIAEQRVASGLTAVIIAISPAMVVGLPWLAGGRRPSALAIAGILIGIAGVAILGLGTGMAGHAPWWAIAAIIAACLSWVAAVLLLPRLDQPEGIFERSGLPMLWGGALLLAASAILGEPRRVSFDDRLLPALAATLYLMLMGSIVAYTAYLWLQRNAPPALATSNVYVNPVIALALGHVLRDEPIDAGMIGGSTLVLAAVGLVTWDGLRRPAAS